ncbi:hypothetical protein DES44_0891 [Roseateles depolymerans]|uniref:Uncharacterized protein n=2 Tax=Roseateles depolymerans TaxID=76731 RepID=A0A0U3NHX6_9BURK|nr:hypothetical protein [Roseateles depolymerans]ALV08016.1 hypothetical protein RD2015_3560 [Roseateles depolymerans]REG21764.1 hypothetical protein DES44_0891 [Roseateles depolymerans]
MMNTISELLTLMARILRGALFLVLFLALLLVGLCVFGVLLVWSLIRGRRLQRPTVGVFRTAADMRAQAFRRSAGSMGGSMGGSMHGGAGGFGAPAAGDIVDVEVREVPQQQPRLER